MRTYRELGDGLFEVDTPAGPLRTSLSREQLEGAGYVPLQGATAQFINPDAPKRFGQTATDAPPPDPSAQGAEPGPAGWNEDEAMDAVRRVAGAPPDAAIPAPALGPNEHAPRTRFDELAKGSEAVANKAPDAGRLPEGAREEDIDLDEQVASGRAAPPPARFHRIPGADIRASFQVQKGNEQLRDETYSKLETLNTNEKLQLSMQGDRDEANRRREIEMYDRDVIPAVERAEIEQRKRLQWIRTEVKQKQDAISRERQAIDKLEVDPDKIWEGKEWARGLMFVSLLAGGALQGWNGGGSNPAWDQLQDAINQSVATQKENYQRRREGLAAQETEFERLMQVYGDPQTAEAELRARHEAVVSAYAKKFAMEVGAEEVKANVAQGMTELDKKLLQDRLQLDQQLSDKVVESWAHRPEQVVQVGGQRPETPEERSRRVNIDGTPGYVLRPGDAPKVQEINDNLSHIDGALSEYQQLMEDPSLGPSERKAAAQALAMRIGPAMAVLQGQGAMSKDEQAALPRGLADPSAWVNLAPDQAKARITTTRRFFGEKRRTVLQNNVYSDRPATQPLLNRAPKVRRE